MSGVETKTESNTQPRIGKMMGRSQDFGHLITDLAAVADKTTEMSLAPFMLSPLEYGILDICSRGEANTVTELSRVTSLDCSSVSRVVSRLVDRRLIGRQRLSKDRRTLRLRLTEEGRALAQRLTERLKARQTLLMNGLSDEERSAFTSMAHKIISNLKDPMVSFPVSDEEAEGPLTYGFPGGTWGRKD